MKLRIPNARAEIRSITSRADNMAKKIADHVSVDGLYPAQYMAAKAALHRAIVQLQEAHDHLKG